MKTSDDFTTWLCEQIRTRNKTQYEASIREDYGLAAQIKGEYLAYRSVLKWLLDASMERKNEKRK